MSRPLRIEFPGALYHVTSRGDRREDIFLDDMDRARLLAMKLYSARSADYFRCADADDRPCCVCVGDCA